MADLKERELARLALGGDLQDQVRHLAMRSKVQSQLWVQCRACEGHGHNNESGNNELDHHGCYGCGGDWTRMGTGKVRWSWSNRLELAAYCSDPVAQALLGAGPQAWLVRVFDLAGGRVDGYWDRIPGVGFVNWLHGLPQWSDAMLRAAVAAAEYALPQWEEKDSHKTHGRGYPDNPSMEEWWRRVREECCDRPRGSITMARRYANDPSPEGRVLWHKAWAEIGAHQGPKDWTPSPISGRYLLAENIQAAAEIVTEKDVVAAIQVELIQWSLDEKQNKEKK